MDYSKFAYLTGRIRALETTLLSENEVERMVDSKSAKDAFRVLNELTYADFLGDINKIEEFQKVIDAGLQETKTLIRKLSPYKWFLNILWYRYDIHNIKTLLKAKIMGKSFENVESILIGMGNIRIILKPFTCIIRLQCQR